MDAIVWEKDAHVMPDWQEHETDTSCWCAPKLTHEDPATGGRVWLHRVAVDLPHDYDPCVTAAD